MLGFCGRLGQGESARVIARSPSGAFRIKLREQFDTSERTTGEYKAFVVPEKEGAAAPRGQRISAQMAPALNYFISPDERWIYADWERAARKLARLSGEWPWN